MEIKYCNICGNDELIYDEELKLYTCTNCKEKFKTPPKTEVYN